jgi:deoxycytidylate deaminase/dephospho-CoA kinase
MIESSRSRSGNPVSTSTALVPPASLASRRSRKNSREIVLSQEAPEFVFAIVGHIGSGTSTVAEQVRSVLQSASFDTYILKARTEIERWARKTGQLEGIGDNSDIGHTKRLQKLGDDYRKQKEDSSVVAAALIRSIVEKRKSAGIGESDDGVVLPDKTRRAYIIDALKHPEEAALLRRVYGPKFILIGVVCDEDVRADRLKKKFENAGEVEARRLMESDAQSDESWGQKVSKTFHLADLFVDNTPERFSDPNTKVGNREWKIPDQLSRLVRILTYEDVVRPTLAETGMYVAYGAQSRSACLSRQVGACLTDLQGDVISIGYNEVPKAGGGVYGADLIDASDEPEHGDHRCAYREGDDQQYCSNTREQNEIIERTISMIPVLAAMSEEDKRALAKEMRKSPIGSLLEFSRAVHAEMDALLSAARKGRETAGTLMFVTTFPCHYCARHIIAAGVSEVHYIEPYPKSQAFKLHGDALVRSRSAIRSRGDEEKHKSVLVVAFTGIAPRMYAHAFLKDRELKDSNTGTKKIGRTEWGDSWYYSRIGYPHLEQKLGELLDD